MSLEIEIGPRATPQAPRASEREPLIKIPLVDRFLGRSLSYREALYQSMHYILQTKPNAILFGQGADDPRGIFGTTLNLHEIFGAERVFDTPIAEEGMTGIAIGAALSGLYPIQTHIRVDFSLLAMNQIVNLAAKYKYMSGGSLTVPLLIRMIIGRSWGQGAQHSQSLQSIFAHIPGLTVLMPSTSQSVLETYPYLAEHHRGPVISLEHRLLYDVDFHIAEHRSHETKPLGPRLMRTGKDVTIVATSIMVWEAFQAAQFLQEHSGIDVEIIDLHSLSPLPSDLILQSVRKTGRLIVADTGWSAFGVSAEICRLVCESCPQALKSAVKSLGMQPAPCPTAKSLEDEFYPTVATLVDAVATSVTGRFDHGIHLPESLSTVERFRKFRGPF